MTLRRVVVTGMGALTPIGNTLEDYWESLKKGKSGSAPITYFDTTNFKTKFACELKEFDGSDVLDKKEMRKMDAFSHYALYSSEEAMKDSGLDLEKVDVDRFGVIWGSGIGGIKSFEEEVGGYVKGNGVPRFSPFFIPKMIIDISPGHISMRYGLRGPNFSTVSACTSASNAIVDAYNYIRLGTADLFVTGGSEAAITEAGIGGFNASRALSTRNDSPDTASRPYDGERDGFVLGEGSATLILEELEHAKARGAKIYAEIIGAGMSADAYHMTAPHPEGLGAMNVMKNALKDANITPKEVDYLNTHGTSTPLGDVAELNAVKQLWGEDIYALNISSTKSMTGHLLGAAGAVEAVAAIMAINHNIVPPTINHSTPDENIDPKINFTFNKAQEREVNVALSNTFGFGGHNCSIVFSRYRE